MALKNSTAAWTRYLRLQLRLIGFAESSSIFPSFVLQAARRYKEFAVVSITHSAVTSGLHCLDAGPFILSVGFRLAIGLDSAGSNHCQVREACLRIRTCSGSG